ncbi:hypothetical protein MNBD_GAMMA02-1266 [hydrothermal vent metagenome]|uniref:Uncharacterized protein n=1 Tax=hydrothermal vent metagenome TaxID=652676 RepID=A0A3B0W8A2_9ZZZZ
MKANFNHIPNNPDTVILFQQQGVFDDIPACYQTWLFDGIRGESIIFLKDDLKNRKDTDLINKVKASKLVQTSSQITLSRNPPDYLFINFNIALE